MILSEKIMLLRKQNGWSQEQLAEQLSVSRQSVSKWESGASLPDLDKIIKLSSLFGVSMDYLVKDEVEEVQYQDLDGGDTAGMRSVSIEETNDYLNIVKQTAPKIAAGIAFCILSPIVMILLAAFSEREGFFLTEDMAMGLGMAVLLVFVAAGVALLIVNGMKLKPYEYLETEEFVLEYGVYGLVSKKKTEFEPKFRTNIAVGCVLCILGAAPLMLAAGMDGGDIASVCCLAILLVFVAVAVCLFTGSGMVQGSYDKLLQEGDYTREKKELNRRTGFFPGIYWCTVTAIYLAVSFYSDMWSRSWVIWPVAGVLFVACMGIVNVLVGRSRKQ